MYYLFSKHNLTIYYLPGSVSEALGLPILSTDLILSKNHATSCLRAFAQAVLSAQTFRSILLLFSHLCPSRTSLSHFSGRLILRLLMRWVSLAQVPNPWCIILIMPYCQPFFLAFPSPWNHRILAGKALSFISISRASVTLPGRVGSQEIFG